MNTFRNTTRNLEMTVPEGSFHRSHQEPHHEYLQAVRDGKISYVQAIRDGIISLSGVPKELRTEEVYLAAVKNDVTGMVFARQIPTELITKEMCHAAVTRNAKKALEYVPRRFLTLDLIMDASRTQPDVLKSEFLDYIRDLHYGSFLTHLRARSPEELEQKVRTLIEKRSAMTFAEGMKRHKHDHPIINENVVDHMNEFLGIKKPRPPPHPLAEHPLAEGGKRRKSANKRTHESRKRRRSRKSKK